MFCLTILVFSIIMCIITLIRCVLKYLGSSKVNKLNISFNEYLVYQKWPFQNAILLIFTFFLSLKLQRDFCYKILMKLLLCFFMQCRSLFKAVEPRCKLASHDILQNGSGQLKISEYCTK